MTSVNAPQVSSVSPQLEIANILRTPPLSPLCFLSGSSRTCGEEHTSLCQHHFDFIYHIWQQLWIGALSINRQSAVFLQQNTSEVRRIRHSYKGSATQPSKSADNAKRDFNHQPLDISRPYIRSAQFWNPHSKWQKSPQIFLGGGGSGENQGSHQSKVIKFHDFSRL